MLVRADEENSQRILRALDEFGFGSLGLTVDDFAVPGHVVQLGVPPVRVDIITSITAVTWKEASTGRIKGTYDEVSVHYIGKAQFITNKRAVGRLKDLGDLEALGEQ